MYGVPRKSSSGAYLRFYSNCRAYLDLGFQVEVVQVVTEADVSAAAPELPVTWSHVVAAPPPRSVTGALMYRAGYPGEAAAAYYFARHVAVRREAMLRERQYPGCLHQFENFCESPIPFLPGINTIWSCHDVVSEVVALSNRIDQKLASRGASIPERRELRFIRNFERRVARNSRLIVCITPKDRDAIRSEWGYLNAEHLPMSIPEVPTVVDRTDWVRSERLNLLHVGAIAHLPTYRSLEFLLTEVFPRLRKEVLERISLRVAGEILADNSRCQRILALCTPYPQVQLLGKVPDLMPFYASSDLQVAASTEATGLRTRVVESFAFGLPVLSTTAACRGVAGIRSGENIVLADTAEAWVQALESILESPTQLSRLARNARMTYDTMHSSTVVATALASFLATYFSIGSPQASRAEAG